MTGNSTKPQTLKSGRATGGRTAVGRLVILDLSGGRVFTVNPDGSDKRVIVTDCHWPDGVALDVEAGHIYWTNMGVPSKNDGSVERVDLGGGPIGRLGAGGSRNTGGAARIFGSIFGSALFLCPGPRCEAPSRSISLHRRIP